MIVFAMVVLPNQADAGEVDPNKSPVLFIHGLNSSSSTWYEDNDMYETVRSQGFETAFIDLNPDKDMWTNGQLLAEKLQEIYQHFGEKVVIVAHSKGGVDAQAALVHYGAHPYVERVITLSSPHKGSELANLAHSSWAGWLADILGNRSEATYALQTGYMSYFRDETDNHELVSANPIYTFGGTGWGPFWGSLFYGGMYLNQFGSNDGAVTVASSRLSYAQEIKVDDWDHYEIKEGNATFTYFEPYLYEAAPLSSFESVPFVEEEASLAYGNYQHGGSHKRKAIEGFFVEDGVEEITVEWISNRKDTDLELIEPAGNQMYSNFKVASDESDVFKGAYRHELTIENPVPGCWKLSASNDQGEDYFFQVNFDSAANRQIDVAVEDGTHSSVAFASSHLKEIKATIRVNHLKKGKPEATSILFKREKNSKVTLKYSGEGVYNLTIDVTGKTPKGNLFNRTVVTSVYLDDKGNIHR
ncbi:esterase/lipase family protein [Thalassobacillus hwangdonensis]|uniref:Esterase/lipase family protein n=1 Tax=Thalassobacillus hwangdonensis TaxID=546108 RepID=A0ABW3L6S3_9BACI